MASVIFDTCVLVPAVVGIDRHQESQAYNNVMTRGEYIFVHEKMTEEYQRVLGKYGLPGTVILLRYNEWYVRGVYRECNRAEEVLVSVPIQNKDMIFLQCAASVKASSSPGVSDHVFLLTTDGLSSHHQDSLLANQSAILKAHRVEVVDPLEYIRLDSDAPR